MTRLLKTVLFCVTALTLSLGVIPVAAQVTPLGGVVNCSPGVPCSGAETFVNLRLLFEGQFIPAAVSLLWVVAWIFLIYAAVKYINSRGDVESAAAAKRQVAYAILGLVVANVAQVIVNVLEAARTAPLDVTPIQTVIFNYITAALPLVTTAAFAYLVYAGVLYITSGGDEERTRSAKNQILYAVVGSIIAGLAYMISLVWAPIGPVVFTIDDLNIAIRGLINPLLILVTIAGFVYLIYAGVIYITSGGDEERARRAKNQLVYAIIGLIIAGLALLISNTFNPINIADVATGDATLNTFGIGNAILIILEAVLWLITIAAVIYIILAGVIYITSGGDEERARRAKNQLIYAIIGLIIVGLAQTIANAFASDALIRGTTPDTTNIVATIRTVINALLSIVAIATAVYIIVAGLLYITSAGDQEQAARGKRQITYAIIGLIIVAISAVIVNLVIGAFS